MEIGCQATNSITSLFLLSRSYGILKKVIKNTENGSFISPLYYLDIDASDNYLFQSIEHDLALFILYRIIRTEQKQYALFMNIYLHNTILNT